MKQIHFVGIKGVGMTPLAIIARQAGFRVTGCDIADEFITDKVLEKEGIIPFVGFNKNHLTGADMVITTGAHGGMGNEEIQYAKQKGISVLTQGQAVGEFMRGDIFKRKFKGISIAGCHGKTTTTAMIATILSKADLDPSYIIGTSEVASLNTPGHYGKGDYFIAEADEYASDPVLDKTPKFLWQHPSILAITNIDFDHPDIYQSLTDVKVAYKKFINNLDGSGSLIVNGDDVNIRKIIIDYKKICITFGKNNTNKYYFLDTNISQAGLEFNVMTGNKYLGRIKISLSGEHNIYNSLCAFAVVKEIGLSFEQIQAGLALYNGAKRRLEFICNFPSGALAYDDYAHHPNEIKTTLEGLKLKFLNKKIVCIFQPHTFSRTKILFDKFKYSFKFADKVIISDIYSSKRETFDGTVSAEELAKSVPGDVIYIPTLAKIADFINKQNFGSDTILITMGAGDVYKVWNYVCRE